MIKKYSNINRSNNVTFIFTLIFCLIVGIFWIFDNPKQTVIKTEENSIDFTNIIFGYNDISYQNGKFECRGEDP